MRSLMLALFAAVFLVTLPGSAFAASYQQNDGTIVDPILYTLDSGGGIHPYIGDDLEPGASLFFAFLDGADLSNANLTGALYDEFTLFPSGNTYDTPPWGLDDGGITPWDAGMILVPEPSVRWMLAWGSAALASLMGIRRHGGYE